MKTLVPLSPKRRHARSWLDELLNARSWRLAAPCGCPNVHVRNDSTFLSLAEDSFRMAASSRQGGPADGGKVGVRQPRTLLEPGRRRLGTFPSPTLSPAKIMLTRSIHLPARSQATRSIPSRPCSLAGRRAARRTPIYLLMTRPRRDQRYAALAPCTAPLTRPAHAHAASGRRGHPGIMPGGPDPPAAACEALCTPLHSQWQPAEIAPARRLLALRRLRCIVRDLLRVRRRSWALRARSPRDLSKGVRLVRCARRSRARDRPPRAPILLALLPPPTGWRQRSGSLCLPVPPLTFSRVQVDQTMS